MKYIIAFFLNLYIMASSFAQHTFPLYQFKIPNSKPSINEEITETRDGITNALKISVPTLSVFLPPKQKANGTAVIIYPGGGYCTNAIVHEGFDVAKKFNDFGVTAFVLRYRIPNEATMIDKETGALQDAQQAIKTVRIGADKWNID
jgi:acetyl esterase/lipase